MASKRKAKAGPTLETWQRMGWQFSCDALTARDREIGYGGKKIGRLTGRLESIMAVMAEDKANNFPAGLQANRDTINRNLNSSGESFCGGSRADLNRAMMGEMDMTRFLAAKEKFDASALADRLRVKMAHGSPKRSRRMSEHDGEWQYDRRWDAAPFASSHRPPSLARVVEIHANFSISGSASAESIDRYGALVWAISDLIESRGVQTRLVWWQLGTGMSPDDYDLCADIKLELKRPGEYLPPSFIAATFTSNFYRRLGFALLGAATDLAGKRVSSGFGGCVTGPVVEFKDGVLIVNPSIENGYTEQLERELLKAVGAAPAEAQAQAV